jgi:hypothetical protein
MFKECSSGDETPHIGESKEGRWTLVKRQLYTKKKLLAKLSRASFHMPSRLFYQTYFHFI